MRREGWFLAPKAPFSELLPLDKYIAIIINKTKLWRS